MKSSSEDAEEVLHGMGPQAYETKTRGVPGRGKPCAGLLCGLLAAHCGICLVCDPTQAHATWPLLEHWGRVLIA